MNQLALSKTAALALSITRNTPYRQPGHVPTLCSKEPIIIPSNIPNRESFGFLLTGDQFCEAFAPHLSGVGFPQSVDGSRKMIERLFKSWTRVPLIVERNFPSIVDSGTDLGLSTRRAGVLPQPRSMLAQQAHGNFQAELTILERSKRRSGWHRFVAHSDASAYLSSPHQDEAVSPRFKDKFHDLREIPKCSTGWKDSTFRAGWIRFQGKPTSGANASSIFDLTRTCGKRKALLIDAPNRQGIANEAPPSAMRLSLHHSIAAAATIFDGVDRHAAMPFAQTKLVTLRTDFPEALSINLGETYDGP